MFAIYAVNEKQFEELQLTIKNIAAETADLADFKEYSNQLFKIAAQTTKPLRVVIMGEFNTGKSTFINALLAEDVVTSDVTPATAVVTAISYSAEKKVIAHFNDGRVTEFSFADLGKITAEDADGKELRNSINYVEIFLPKEILKKITFVDTPGLNVNNQNHIKATKDIMNTADTVLWVFTCGQTASRTELAAIEELNARLKPIAIINKIDAIDEEEESLDDIITDAKRKLKNKVSQVIGVSAQLAMNGILNNDSESLKLSGWENLKTALNQEVLNNINSYKLNSILEDLTECLSKILVKCEQNSDTDRLLRPTQDTLIAELSKIIRVIEPLCKTEANSSTVSMQTFLGCIYYNGYGISQDYGQAKYWCEKAARQCNAVAQYWLGNIYDEGHGVVVDHGQAQYWYKQAADQGHAGARLRLGLIYKRIQQLLAGNYAIEDISKVLKQYKAELNGRQYEQLLTVTYKVLKGTVSDYDLKLYDKIMILFETKKYDYVLDLFEFKHQVDFMRLISQNIAIFKETLTADQFNRLLQYFYNKIKSTEARIQAHAKNNNSFTTDVPDYLLTQIEVLYVHKKYDQAIELLEGLIPFFEIQEKRKLLKQALKRLILSYLKSGSILKCFAFISTLLVKRHPTKVAAIAVLIMATIFSTQLKELVGPYFSQKSMISGNNRPVNATSQSESKAKSNPAPIALKDGILAGVRLNSNITEAKSILGAPLKVDGGRDGSIYTFKNGIELTVIDGKVVAIIVDESKISTERAVRVGDSADKVLSAYGSPAISAYDRYDLYEYFYEGNDAYILRFAVDKQSKTVGYIGVRLKQTGNSAQNGSSSKKAPVAARVAVINMSGVSSASNQIIGEVSKAGFSVANYGDAIATIRKDTMIAVYTDDPVIIDNPKIIDAVKALPFKHYIEYRKAGDVRSAPAGPVEVYIGQDNIRSR